MRHLLAFVCPVLFALSPILADEIKVSPGPGAIAAALAKAKEGDVVKLAAGEYAESVEIPAGVSVEGAGADKTTITATDYAAINCKGPHIRIAGLTIKPAEKTIRGVNASLPVRVERCRFVNVKEGVALMTAPLSDVVACDFVDCGIGVRAIGGACPTVWGCSFKGGNMGVFGMDGSPYIRNNLFDSTKTGIRLAPDGVHPTIIRNNVFVNCPDAAIEILPTKTAIFGPSIRNSIFSDCGVALISSKDMAKNTSHSLVNGGATPAFRAKDGTETAHLGDASLAVGDAGVTIAENRTLTLAHPELADAKGIRLCTEKEGAKGTIGLEKDWRALGVGATATLPPARFGGKRLIANSVAEEYQYLQTLGRRANMQSVRDDAGVMVDVQTLDDGKKPSELVFDISRFYSETSLK